MANADRSGRKIALAAVAGAHGVRGEVRLKLFTDELGNLKAYRTLTVGGVPRRLLEVRAGGAMAVGRFEGISGRDEAEALRGSLVEVEREELPPLDEGEYYHADLIGLSAVDRDGKPVGTVIAVENYGAGDLLEIELADGKQALIPFKPGIADPADGAIVVDRDFLA